MSPAVSDYIDIDLTETVGEEGGTSRGNSSRLVNSG